MLAALAAAMMVNAEVTTIYSFDGTNAKEATESGATAVVVNPDVKNNVAFTGQKGNYCYKLGKTLKAVEAQLDSFYVAIELAEPLKGGEKITVGAFRALKADEDPAEKVATLGIDFNENGLTATKDVNVTYVIAEYFIENGTPKDVELTVPAEAAGKKYIRVYRQTGKTAAYVNKLVITSEEEPTAVENAEAEVKAVKVVENGQLVIIKNGVRYNAAGAAL